eukprot:jgi/Mesvir1/27290/Mv07123-RA.1
MGVLSSVTGVIPVATQPRQHECITHDDAAGAPDAPVTDAAHEREGEEGQVGQVGQHDPPQQHGQHGQHEPVMRATHERAGAPMLARAVVDLAGQGALLGCQLAEEGDASVPEASAAHAQEQCTHDGQEHEGQEHRHAHEQHDGLEGGGVAGPHEEAAGHPGQDHGGEVCGEGHTDGMLGGMVAAVGGGDGGGMVAADSNHHHHVNGSSQAAEEPHLPSPMPHVQHIPSQLPDLNAATQSPDLNAHVASAQIPGVHIPSQLPDVSAPSHMSALVPPQIGSSHVGGFEHPNTLGGAEHPHHAGGDDHQSHTVDGNEHQGLMGGEHHHDHHHHHHDHHNHHPSHDAHIATHGTIMDGYDVAACVGALPGGGHALAEDHHAHLQPHLDDAPPMSQPQVVGAVGAIVAVVVSEGGPHDDPGREGALDGGEEMPGEDRLDTGGGDDGQHHQHHQHHHHHHPHDHDGQMARSSDVVMGGGMGADDSYRRQVPVRRKTCKGPGCPKRPSFGVPGGVPEFCFTHKDPGHVDVTSRRCSFVGCTKRASYGLPKVLGEANGKGRAQFCFAHKMPDHTNVDRKRCSHPGCTRQPAFGIQGGPRSVCGLHKDPNDVNVSKKGCQGPGCSKRACFGPPEGPVMFCLSHKSPSHIDIISKRCLAPGCGKRASFGEGERSLDDPTWGRGGGWSSSGPPLYCSLHKGPNHVNVVHKRTLPKMAQGMGPDGKRSRGGACQMLEGGQMAEGDPGGVVVADEEGDPECGNGEEGLSLGPYHHHHPHHHHHHHHHHGHLGEGDGDRPVDMEVVGGGHQGQVELFGHIECDTGLPEHHQLMVVSEGE